MDNGKYQHESCCCGCSCEQSNNEVSCSCGEHTCKDEVCSCGNEYSCSEDSCGCEHSHAEVSCGCGCGCGEEHEGSTWELVLGGVLFLVTELLGIVPEGYQLYALVLAYLLLGWRIVWKSLQNILKGKVFDENFLMSVATLCAFAIGEYAEAVFVMLFYQVGELFQSIAVGKSRSLSRYCDGIKGGGFCTKRRRIVLILLCG